MVKLSEALRILHMVETHWAQLLSRIERTEDELDREALVGRGLINLLTPLYCHEESLYYRDASLLPWMKQGVQCLLGDQLESGCISLLNCNIDSPPDTAFQVHGTAIAYQVLVKSGLPELSEIVEGIRLFLERAKPCLLTGGIHTPNHRWVMCGALANMYEIFGDEAFKRRAFQFLDEGLDITEYGEWTERSNAMYNSALAIHLVDVGEVFGHEASYEAVRKNLLMMPYMFHPGNDIVTEYSGRQDLGQRAKMNDWYYTSLHLMASKDRDPALVSLARLAEETASVGSHALMYWMLYPERMTLPEGPAEPLSEYYTIFLGEGNQVNVPANIPYGSQIRKHPHGAPLVRHRRGQLSVTVMSAQPELLYVQFGHARMVGYKLGLGWFGIANVSFPSIVQIGSARYRMEVELEGCYFDALPPEKVQGLNGSYVDMPNRERAKTHVTMLQVAMEFELLENGVDITLISDNVSGVYFQHVFQFDPDGALGGEGIRTTDAARILQLTSGYAVYKKDGDCIEIGPGEKKHRDVVMRNEKPNPDVTRLTINSMTPLTQTLSIRCYEAEREERTHTC
ncbi:hypothetical protein SAMN02799630_00123 [Paenibacillus sp. UNCCL117]|uniref:hypothetical protein n=1 Tax=unclassified Paenibacillus TaxID=185978 RepID=UPI00087E5B29|nr:MULTISPECIES: hypothetical protein [unclassified Paenibacillus]SDC51882.1 hypothetical protein SAMN04488602_102409 [Paenibacillus sp. cl123]SFW11397.1 hypothetical protein SAMN02799630_00123 [Paenibacillus sp. UNCCL117]